MTRKPPDNYKSGKPKMSGGKPKHKPRRFNKKTLADNEIRMMDEKVKTAKGRKLSSTLWLRRQLNDPYVKKAQQMGYRSRAAFKLLELDEKFKLLKPGALVVDLGAAPGSWTQVALEAGAGKIIGIDILPTEHISGADIIEMDFMSNEAPKTLMEMIGGKADLVMSDLAANTTGHRQTDHLRTIALVEAAAEFAMDILKPGGDFVCKVFQGGAQADLLGCLKKSFKKVRHAKPKASRTGSPEIYLVAKGFMQKNTKN